MCRAWLNFKKITHATHHKGGVDALAGEGVNVTGSVADDQQVVIVGGGNALGAQAQRSRLHALYLCAGADRLANEGVALQRALVQPLQVRFLQTQHLLFMLLVLDCTPHRVLWYAASVYCVIFAMAGRAPTETSPHMPSLPQGMR